MKRIDALLPPPRATDWELHMVHMAHGKGHFSKVSRAVSRELVAAVLDVIDLHNLTLFMMVVDKPKLIAKYYSPDSPEMMTYEWMVERFQFYLERRPVGGPWADRLGMVVADAQKGQEDLVRAAQQGWRQSGTSTRAIGRVIETPFFVPSHSSMMLQIIDVAAFWCNLWLKAQAAGRPTPPEWALLEPHLDRDNSGRCVGLKIFPAKKAAGRPT